MTISVHFDPSEINATREITRLIVLTETAIKRCQQSKNDPQELAALVDLMALVWKNYKRLETMKSIAASYMKDIHTSAVKKGTKKPTFYGAKYATTPYYMKYMGVYLSRLRATLKRLGKESELDSLVDVRYEATAKLLGKKETDAIAYVKRKNFTIRFEDRKTEEDAKTLNKRAVPKTAKRTRNS